MKKIKSNTNAHAHAKPTRTPGRFVAWIGLVAILLTVPAMAKAEVFYRQTYNPAEMYPAPERANYTSNLVRGLIFSDLVVRNCEIVSENNSQNPFAVRVLVKNIGDAASPSSRVRPVASEAYLIDLTSQLYGPTDFDDPLFPYQIIPGLAVGQQTWLYMGEINLPDVSQPWLVGLTFEVDYERKVIEKNESNNLFDCEYIHEPL